MDAVEVERYDPYNKSWCAISPALKYVSNFAAASCLGKLYLVGSCAIKYNALTLQCYNPVQGENGPCCHTPPMPSRAEGDPQVGNILCRQAWSCNMQPGLTRSDNGYSTGPGAIQEHRCWQHGPESQTSSTAWT